jgi:hypothetical protein
MYTFSIREGIEDICLSAILPNTLGILSQREVRPSSHDTGGGPGVLRQFTRGYEAEVDAKYTLCIPEVGADRDGVSSQVWRPHETDAAMDKPWGKSPRLRQRQQLCEASGPQEGLDYPHGPLAVGMFCIFTFRDLVRPEAVDKRFRVLISHANRLLSGWPVDTARYRPAMGLGAGVPEADVYPLPRPYRWRPGSQTPVLVNGAMTSARGCDQCKRMGHCLSPRPPSLLPTIRHNYILYVSRPKDT